MCFILCFGCSRAIMQHTWLHRPFWYAVPPGEQTRCTVDFLVTCSMPRRCQGAGWQKYTLFHFIFLCQEISGQALVSHLSRSNQGLETHCPIDTSFYDFYNGKKCLLKKLQSVVKAETIDLQKGLSLQREKSYNGLCFCIHWHVKAVISLTLWFFSLH